MNINKIFYLKLKQNPWFYWWGHSKWSEQQKLKRGAKHRCGRDCPVWWARDRKDREKMKRQGARTWPGALGCRRLWDLLLGHWGAKTPEVETGGSRLGPCATRRERLEARERIWWGEAEDAAGTATSL